MKRFKWQWGVVLITMMVLLFTGCGAKEEETSGSNGTPIENVGSKPKVDNVRIGFVDSGKGFPTEVVGIAKEKGLIEEELNEIGVKVEWIPFVGAGPAINEALSSNSIDIGFYGDTPALLGKASGIKTTLIAATNTALDAGIVVPYDSPIKKVEDLKGKRVATLKGSYMHKFLVEALKSKGLSTRDFEFFHMKSVEAETALISKKIDAIAASNTSVAKLVLNKQGRVIIDAKDNPEWKGLSLALVRTEYARENSAVIEGVLKALIKGKEFIDSNPEEAKNIWPKSGFPREVYDYLYPDNDFTTLDVSLTDQVIEKLNYNKEFLKAEGLLKVDVDLKQWADKSYYEKAIQK